MPINFNCACGQPLVVAAHFAGLNVQCPQCGEQTTVPEAGPAGQPKPWENSAAPAPKPWASGAAQRPWENAGDEPAPAPNDPNNPFGFTSPGESARERDRQVRERENPGGNTGGRSLEGGILNGVSGGMLAMIIAVVWFVVGLAADVIFFYPPILFIIGLVAFFKGLAQGPGSSA